jgi:Protein of unknown function (DUF3309)
MALFTVPAMVFHWTKRSSFESGRDLTVKCDVRDSPVEAAMPLSTILIIILILVLIGALPTWPYSAGWGYGPGGILGLILVIIIILAVLGRI